MPTARLDPSPYTTRMLGALVAALLLVIAAVRWWPAPSGAPEPVTYDARAQEVIAMEEILPTRQRARRPPPPAPAPPVVLPTDVTLPEVELDLQENVPVTDAAGDDAGTEEAETTETAGGPVTRAEVAPRLVRFVQPTYTREAERRGIRAEVVVRVLVDTRGRVEEAAVEERYLLGDDDEPRTAVDALGYGLDAAALDAARQLLFRPARQDGTAVRSYTTVTFTFGV